MNGQSAAELTDKKMDKKNGDNISKTFGERCVIMSSLKKNGLCASREIVLNEIFSNFLVGKQVSLDWPERQRIFLSAILVPQAPVFLSLFST